VLTPNTVKHKEVWLDCLPMWLAITRHFADNPSKRWVWMSPDSAPKGRPLHVRRSENPQNPHNTEPSEPRTQNTIPRTPRAQNTEGERAEGRCAPLSPTEHRTQNRENHWSQVLSLPRTVVRGAVQPCTLLDKRGMAPRSTRPHLSACHLPVPAQVMALRMLLDERGYEDGTDVEGGAMADRINAQLPPEVRVLAVQKVRGCMGGAARDALGGLSGFAHGAQ